MGDSQIINHESDFFRRKILRCVGRLAIKRLESSPDIKNPSIYLFLILTMHEWIGYIRFIKWGGQNEIL
jgi:hypothetical protein